MKNYSLLSCHRLLIGSLLAFVLSFVITPGFAEEHEHQVSEQTTNLTRSEVDYKIPKLTLLRQDGSSAQFPKELDDGRPVILSFVFTSCTAICPVITAVFSSIQHKLGKESAGVHRVLISIDPDYDTPARLTEYAKKFKADAGWQFYTGTPEASIALQKAFAVYRGDKMNHPPIIFLKGTHGKTWVRLEGVGISSPDKILHEYHQLK